MDIGKICVIVIVFITLIVLILHKLFNNSNSKIAQFINKIWDEWFEDQYKAIITAILFIIIVLIIGITLR